MKKLFICSEFYAGMLPFGSAIINTMRGEDTFGIFICTNQCDYKKTIIPNGNNYLFIDFPTSKIKKLLFRIYPFTLIKNINKLIKSHNISVVHLLTEDSSVAFNLKRMQKQASVFYTVHDLVPHEQKFSSITSWFLRSVLIQPRVSYLIKHTANLVTCSSLQYRGMKSNFTDKNIFYHNFPSLLTESVKTGRDHISELEGVEDYILFFGLIEKYKGIHILYNAYLHHPDNKKQLVIAGKGDLYFTRNPEKENKKVIFINRYIADQEVKELFSKAYCVVFPYISATQSGVLSLSYFFRTPSVVSNIPFFMETIIDNVTSLSFAIDDIYTLMTTVDKLATISLEELKDKGFEYYQSNYSIEALKNQLDEIYTN